MKKIILFAAILLSIMSCSKEDGIGLKADMSAKVDDVDWKTVTRVTVLNDQKYIITGTSLDGKSLSITIIGTAEGIYELSLSFVKIAAVYKESLSTSTEDAYIATSGIVELTEVNTSAKEISGTFNLVLRKNLTGDSINITEGSFTGLKYTESEQ